MTKRGLQSRCSRLPRLESGYRPTILAVGMTPVREFLLTGWKNEVEGWALLWPVLPFWLLGLPIQVGGMANSGDKMTLRLTLESGLWS
jgi:hypothetical protein